MKKSVMLLLVLVIMVATALAGCANDGSPSNSTKNEGSKSETAKQPEAAKQPAATTALSLWLFNDLHKTFYEKTAQLWNEKNPDKPIELKIETYPNADMHNKLLIALQSGVGAPDIADINITFFQNFLKGDIQLAELNDIIDPERDKFIQSRFDVYARDGKNYGIDFHVGATVVYYNKEMMDKANVNIEEIKTWNDYVEAGKKVVAATGKMMTAFEVTNNRPFWPMIIQRGSDYLDKDGNVILDNEINVQTLQSMHDMIYKDKIAVPAPGGNTGSEEFFTFMNKGEVASIIMPMWYMGRLTSYMPDLEGKILIRPMPVWKEGDDRSAGIGGTGTAVTKQSKHVELSKEFLAYAKLSKESNIRIWQELQFDPIRWDVWDAPELREPIPYFGNEIVFDVLMQVKDEISSPNMHLLSAAALDVVNNSVLFKSLSQESHTPKEALEESANELRKQSK
jgi:arabinosaccharide transport system substrate-binding protein